MAAWLLQTVLGFVAGAAIVVAARRGRIRVASPALSAAFTIFELIGWLVMLLEWSFLLRAAAGNMTGLALWIASVIAAVRCRERSIAILQHDMLESLAASAESAKPDDAERIADLISQAIAEPSPGNLRLLSDSGRAAAVFSRRSAAAPLLRLAAQWEATYGLARERFRTRLVYAGLVFSIALVSIASLIAGYGLPLLHLTEDLADRLPEAVVSRVATLGALADWSASHPLWLLAGTWLVFSPWFHLVLRWNWLAACSGRWWPGPRQISTPLLLRLLGQARQQALDEKQLAAALTSAAGYSGRRWRQVAAACAADRPLWLALSEAGLLNHSMAESLQAAERQDRIAVRSSELAEALAQRELILLRRLSAGLSLVSVVCVVAAVLLMLLVVWLPLLKLSLPM